MSDVHAPRSDRLAAFEAFTVRYLADLQRVSSSDVVRAPCIGYGRGGIAYVLLRAGLAHRRDDLLAAAANWAVAGLRSAHPFELRGWPKTSYSRGLAGLYALVARIADSRGDRRGRERAIEHFVAVNHRARHSLDLFHGMAGRLAGAAALHRALPDPRIGRLADDLRARLLAALRSRVASVEPWGLAHGRPGLVLALLTWQLDERDADLCRAELRRFTRYQISGLGWARGHAGMAHLFARAYQHLNDRWLLEAARAAGEQALLLPPSPHLVYGKAGVAYSLLALSDADPGGPWRRLARQVARDVVAHVELPTKDPYGVWSGASGIYCLADDVMRGATGFPAIEA